MVEIFVSKNEIALLENGKLSEYYIDEKNLNRKEGNIYIGVIKDIIKGMQAAFVDIGTEKNSFIHLKDILKKVDESKGKIEENVDINNIAKPNQKLLVQVKKDSNLQKGARVSTHINLPSRYIVLMPNTDIITVSQKIEDKKEQERLRNIVKENLSKGNGAVIRTSAVGKEKELIEDIKNIENKWNDIQKSIENYNTSKPKLVAEAEDILEKMIIDLPDNSIKKIVISDKNKYQKIVEFKEKYNYLKETEIQLKQNEDILGIYDIKKEISKIENRKVWLKCGGFITIDKTEALTAIDVNTGKYTGNKDAEQTIYKVNEEATIEIAKQLKLRNIGGIIVIDYIDMKNEENKKNIQSLLEENLKKDRAKTQVEGFTKLDLMEMTRKHI